MNLFIYFKFIYRQQNSETSSSPSKEGDADGNNKSGKVKSAAAILAQKRVYQKHLRTLQQSSLARDVLQSKWPSFQII
jgi:hypothetical protein